MEMEEALALIAELRAQNALLLAQNEELRTQNGALVLRVGELEQRVRELEALKTPPPPWAKANRPKPEKSEGHTRTKRAAEHNRGRHKMTPTRIVQHAYARCPDCDYALRGASIARRREVIDLPETPMEVTEHQILKRYCPVCGAWKTPRVALEGEVLGQGRLGLRLLSLMGVLRVVHRLPLALIQELLAQLYGLHLSEGGIQQSLERLREGLEPTHAAIVAESRASPSRHLDETGWRQDGQNGYLWVAATDGPTPTRVYTYRTSRAGTVADELVGDYAGVLVTDGYAAYDHLPCTKQRCWTHLLRTARELREKHPQETPLADWTQALKTLYVHATQVAQTPTLTLAQRAAAANDAERRLRQLCLCYDHVPTHPAHALARWMHRHQDELFTFVRVPGVAGTNNLAERAVRPQVIARKISGGSRSDHGTTIRCDLATVFYTFKAQGLNPVHACLAALQTPLPQV